MALPLKSTIYTIYVVVLAALAGLLSQGIHQHRLFQEHESVISQTQNLIFQFSIIREQVSESLLAGCESELKDISPEMEKLNSNLASILADKNIGDEYKLTFLNSIDLPGIILLLRKIEGGNGKIENIRELNREMRTLGERLILFDRLLVNNAKEKLIGFQNIIIGSASLIVFLLVTVLAVFHRQLIIPLLELVKKSASAVSGQINSIVVGSSSKEVSQLTESFSQIIRQRRLIENRVGTARESALNIISSLEGVWAEISKDGEIVSINHSIAEKCGFSVEELTGKTWQEFFLVRDTGLLDTEDGNITIHDLCETQNALLISLATSTERNRTVRCCFIRNPLSDDEMPSVYCLGIDLSDEYEKIHVLEESLTEAKNKKVEMVRISHLATLGEMTTGVAHEIGNLTNGIINYAQVLADGACDPEFELERDKLFHKIIIEGERIADLSKNLLAFGQDDVASKELAKIDDVLRNSLALMGHYFKIDGTRVDTVLDTIPICKANGRQIQQVFLSILTNARRALNERFPQKDDRKILRIEAAEIEKEGKKMLALTFTDFGTGISPENVNKVFEPSFSTKPASEGVGMGLSVSKELVELHDGHIFLESKENNHTTVTVELPVSS
ncbi:MAG: PAS domain-containing protein [Desulfobulbaceae bacterium]|nr:PAS domain-containing protein [Desulfobulbaceae bacterium]